MNLLAEDIASREPRIDRNHPVAALQEIFESKIAWPVVLRRDADHGNRLDGVEDAANVAVRVIAVIHYLAPCRCEIMRKGRERKPCGTVTLPWEGLFDSHASKLCCFPNGLPK